MTRAKNFGNGWGALPKKSRISILNLEYHNQYPGKPYSFCKEDELRVLPLKGTLKYGVAPTVRVGERDEKEQQARDFQRVRELIAERI